MAFAFAQLSALRRPWRSSLTAFRQSKRWRQVKELMGIDWRTEDLWCKSQSIQMGRFSDALICLPKYRCHAGRGMGRPHSPANKCVDSTHGLPSLM
eukprot:863470-Amorphochlora_amoeboformis.AAC.1